MTSSLRLDARRPLGDPSRRQLLRAGGAFSLGLAGCQSVATSGPSSAPAIATLGASKLGVGELFTLGVASGDPVADGMVLWTRLAPDPLNPDPVLRDAVPVVWEVSEDATFGRVVRRGQTLARPEWGHSVHVEPYGLAPGRPYYYRFIADGQVSPVGRTRTAPVHLAPLDRLRFGFASCQHFEQGYFTAYRDALARDLDLFIHLGDYIYEGAWGPQVRRQAVIEAMDLSEYRRLHAQYKLDPDLQAAHAAMPWLMIWDDHEVVNDYADLNDEDYLPVDAMRARRAAAYQAYYEHMPVRVRSRPRGPDMHFHGASTWGDLAAFALTDARQYRTDHACQTPEDGGGRVVTCDELDAPSRTLLGSEQERWLNRGLGRSGATWELLAQPTLFSRLFQTTRDGEPGAWSDGWDGYPRTRQRILDTVQGRGLSNFVSIGGDMHSWWQADLKADFDNPESATIGTEFVTTSVTAHSYSYNTFNRMLPDNPHIGFMDTRERGYAVAEITPARMEVEFREVESVYALESPTRIRKRYVVESGRPGAVEA